MRELSSWHRRVSVSVSEDVGSVAPGSQRQDALSAPLTARWAPEGTQPRWTVACGGLERGHLRSDNLRLGLPASDGIRDPLPASQGVAGTYQGDVLHALCTSVRSKFQALSPFLTALRSSQVRRAVSLKYWGQGDGGVSREQVWRKII